MAEASRFFFGLRFKFTLLLALFAAALMGGTMMLMEQNLRQSLVTESIEKGLGVARGVAFNVEDPLLTGDDLYLFSAVQNAIKSPGILYARIVDEQGVVKAADRMDLVGRPLIGPGEERQELVRQGEDFLVRRLWLDEEPVLDLAVPVYVVAEQRLYLGDIHLGLSESIIGQAVQQMRRLLAALTVIVLVVAALVASFLATLLVRPVNALVNGVRAIAAGNLDQCIESRRKDEIGVLTGAFNDMAASLQEKEFIKNTFERFVSKQLAEQILERKDEVRLGGEEKEVTILFCDIRRFTALAEQFPAAQVVEMLNDYFTRMIQVINDHGGMVDKFMGDAILALFGAPIALGDDPLNAVRCAQQMQREVGRFNRERADLDLPPVEMGVGINTGMVVAGNIGSATRMEYTVIGDNVNVAARLQGVAGPGEILISEGTYAHVRADVQVTPMEPFVLKGRKMPVGVYRVDGSARSTDSITGDIP